MAGPLQLLGRACVRPLSIAVLGACVASLLAAGCGGDGDPGEAPRVNFIVVLTDDQTVAQMNARTMPFTQRLLAEGGTSLTDAIVATPLCCPARASYLTGQYPHNHGAWNSYKTFERRDDNLATWLDFAGYRTAMVGKYLNAYESNAPTPTTPARGWDQWRMLLEPLSYYDYDVAVNGRRVHRGSRPRDYETTYLNNEVRQLITHWAPQGPPFFIWYAPHAPHDEKGKTKTTCAGRAVPAPGDLRDFRDAPLPRPPSFNEPDTSDKPAFMRELRELSAAEIEEIEGLYRCRLASLREVDRGVADIARELEAQGALDDTVIVVASDNGLFHGEHRIGDSKRLPYAEAVDVPVLLRVPEGVLGAPAENVVRQPVSNIDLAPTLLDLANVPPCSGPDACLAMDGRSLVPLLRGDVEEWPEDRGRLIEMRNCDYSGLIAEDQVSIHYTSVPRTVEKRGCEAAEVYERYDLDADPFQLDSLASVEADIPAPLLERLDRAETCTGIAGRDPKPPPGLSYCE